MTIFSLQIYRIRLGIFTIDKSDLLPIFIIYKDYLKTDRRFPKEITYRLINEATLNNFYEQFISEVATFPLDDSNANFLIKLLNEKILKCYKFCCPIENKTFSVKDQKKPWISYEIKEII